MIGTRLAHFEITAHLGTGGMGEVYQATDTKLGRSVAIKLLPEAFARDAERVARFEREARVLAAGGAAADVFKTKGSFRYPVFLSDGRHFLYTDIQPSETSGINVSSLDGGENRRILPDRSAVVFAPSFPGSRSGRLLFVRETEEPPSVIGRSSSFHG